MFPPSDVLKIEESPEIKPVKPEVKIIFQGRMGVETLVHDSAPVYVRCISPRSVATYPVSELGNEMEIIELTVTALYAVHVCAAIQLEAITERITNTFFFIVNFIGE